MRLTKTQDQPAHPLIYMHLVNILISLRANAQVDLNLGWAHMSEGTFTDVKARLTSLVLTWLSYDLFTSECISLDFHR